MTDEADEFSTWVITELRAEVDRLRAEVETVTEAYDELRSDADALTGRLRERISTLEAMLRPAGLPKHFFRVDL